MTDHDSRAELPACPFCNGSAEFIESSGDWGYTPDTYYVSCQKCDCETAQYGTAKKAIAAWTRRAPVSGFAAGIEAAAKVCERISAEAVQEYERLRGDPGASLVPTLHRGGIATEIAARIRSLTPSPDAGVVEKWMGIERAPKDGTSVLLRYERTEDLPEPWPLVIIGRWAHEVTGQGFWVWQGRAARGYGVGPTHWMPLPTPPALAALRTIGEADE